MAITKSAPETKSQAAPSAPSQSIPPVPPASTPNKMSRADLIAAAAAGKIKFEDTTVGETFGLNYKRLELKAGETSGPLEYIKDDKVPVEKEDDKGNKTTEMLPMQVLRDAANPDAGLISTPIGKVFQKHWGEAAINVGDIVQIHRYADARMKRGKAAGREIPIFGVKVIFRSIAE